MRLLNPCAPRQEAVNLFDEEAKFFAHPVLLNARLRNCSNASWLAFFASAVGELRIARLSRTSYRTGAPYMRALFMDFPGDPKAADIPDEYMFGPAFLVAPVTEQGATHRTVYLPAGSDWYNFWTNERLRGGQSIKVDAPIDILPLFVRAGSILPLGSEVQSSQQPQTIASVRVYPGADGEFTLFQDDGKTYAYEKTGGSVTKLTWDDAAHRLKHQGASAWSGPDHSIVSIVGR